LGFSRKLVQPTVTVLLPLSWYFAKS